jgi:hypothetical protein
VVLPASPTDAPTPPPGAAAAAPRPARPGQLTVGWRFVVGLAWSGVIVGFMVVWKASRDIGLSTWWLGPAGEPQPFYVSLLPFLAPTAMLLGVVNGARLLPWGGLAAAAVTAAVGLGDVGRVPGLAAAELALAAGGAAVSVASLGGRYRSP